MMKPPFGVVVVRACGHADVLNLNETWLTKMQAVRYFVAFKVVKAAESVFNAVSSCLSPKQKTIFVMNQMDDMPSSEIAKVLGCRESTVRNHLFNARKLMQVQLQKRYPEYAQLWRNR